MGEVDSSSSPVAAGLARLAPSLARGATGIAGLRRLTGGASLETWAFDATGPGIAAPLILRRRGEGDSEVFETSLPLDSEAQLIQAADAHGVPVARVIHRCTPADGLGEAYVVERVRGEALGRRIAQDETFAPARDILGRQCGAALARVHRIPLEGLPPLERMDGPSTLARYEAIWRRADLARPAIEAAIKWLEAEAPAPVAPCLLHGDFRNGNLMVDPGSGLVAALDWEIAHIGDPAEDLGWLCVNSWRFGRVDRQVGGFATLDELLDGYAGAGGEPPSRASIRYWQMLGSFKWAVITNMMYRTYAEGNGSLERAVIGRRLSECEVDLLALMEARA